MCYVSYMGWITKLRKLHNLYNYISYTSHNLSHWYFPAILKRMVQRERKAFPTPLLFSFCTKGFSLLLALTQFSHITVILSYQYVQENTGWKEPQEVQS